MFDVAHPGINALAAKLVVTTYPTKFIVDRRGVVRDVFVGSGPATVERIESEINGLLAENP
jgi:hypothetical protein